MLHLLAVVVVIAIVDSANPSTIAPALYLAAGRGASRGLAGFIVDGYIRDLPEIVPLDWPVFARGTTAIGPLHRGPGRPETPGRRAGHCW